MKRVGAGHRHGAKRRNNPSMEATRTAAKERRKPKQKRPDRSGRTLEEVPHLAWQRETKRETVQAPVFATTERIEPGAWLADLCKGAGQGEMEFREGFNGFKNRAAAQMEWFMHEGYWSNRLIYGDSERVMASLLEQERMQGEVQMVYFDPPYGFDFDAEYADDATFLTQFRDTYRKGIHGYLDGLETTLTLARELLTETGSLFMQIGNVNVHRAAMVLDEVFRAENRVSTIAYQTGGGNPGETKLSRAGDWILWYAKNKEAMHFEALHEGYVETKEWLKGQGKNTVGAVFNSGEDRKLTSAERRDIEKVEEGGARLWATGDITSRGRSTGETGQPFVFRGTRYGTVEEESGAQGEGLERRHWSVDQEGMKTLAEMDRLWTNQAPGTPVATVTSLSLRLYKDETQGKRITNLWPESISAEDKWYSVQTGDRAIERCMLMTTRPGDLVLDPTAGSGTTAVVAERWGRRWITSDACRGSIAAARERILSTEYPKHLLVATKEGFKRENEIRAAIGQPLLQAPPECGENDPAGGIVVSGQPYVTAATLAYAGRPDKAHKQGQFVRHPNRPEGGRQDGRVAGPFTVEADATRVHDNPEVVRTRAQAKHDASWTERALERLEAGGVQAGDGSRWNITSLEAVEEPSKGIGAISHRATLENPGSGARRSAMVSVWPDDAKVDVEGVHHTVDDMRRHGSVEDHVLVLAGAAFSADVRPGASTWACEVVLAKAKAEVQLGRVDGQSRQPSFTMVAEPSIKLVEEAKNTLTAELEGWSEFNPGTGRVEFVTKEKVRMWMLDTAYDGTHFCARRIHLTRERRNKQHQRFVANVLGALADKTKVRTTWGYVSAPFKRPGGRWPKIAVKVITEQDGELFGVTELE